MNNLAELLFKNFPSAQYASGKNEIMMKCPFCGDSTGRNKHFYVSIKEGELHYYNCFKCGAKGILTGKILRNLNIYDAEASKALDNYNLEIAKNRKITYTQPMYKKFQLVNTYIRDDTITKTKLDYLNNRLNIDLSYQDCLSLKIVLNLKDFLDSNNITYYTRDQDIVDQLDKYFIGFLSSDNSFVTLRNIDDRNISDNINHRYIEYNIFNKRDTDRYYTIPTVINTVDPTPINIHFAEGVFDILSIFFNCNNRNTYQNIYTSIGGKTYLSHLQMFLIRYGFINAIYHIYIDNDIDTWTINELKAFAKTMHLNMLIHRNMYPDQKDFGVGKEYIKDVII